MAEALRGVSVWAFHGRNDVVCPSSVSELLVAELRRQGTNDSEAKITLYEHAPAPKGWPDYDGHGATIPAYATPALYRWLLERSVRAS
jgi:predicted peptidase